MLNEFSRTELLLGSEAVDAMKAARVAVFGIGGVGGYVAEALVRSGLGAIDLVDNDTVCLTNINRQIFATHKTVGQYKTEAACARIADINPNCTVTQYKTFFLPETANEIDFTKFDYVVDAIDTVTGKIAIIENAVKHNVPVISAMGAGNKLDPTKFEVADISKTTVCPLARVMRRELRARGINHVKVVYSKEEPVRTLGSSEEGTVRKDIPGSVAFVPSVMGLILAGEVVKDLTGKRGRA